jgi:hypothetical protein
MTLPELPGIVNARDVSRTAEHIVSLQQPDGLIPWFAGEHGDPWDHVEAAMALTVAGRVDEARASLSEFRRRYPAFAIPADLQPLLAPAPAPPAAPAPAPPP